ncbi:MAG: hypothetical protein WC829_21940 [Hyphomicrobium sp.]
MLRPSTITVATIAACGVTLALGGSLAVQPRFVHPTAAVTPVIEEPSSRKSDPLQIPHKFMRAPPTTL